MKRSEVNRIIEVAQEVFSAAHLCLPPFALWTAADWKNKGSETDEIRKAQLGWDVTDFGRGQFEKLGRTLFNLRNGFRRDGGYSKTYAEKFILNPANQKPPLHFHRRKMEDIINRGGGKYLIRLFKSTDEGKCSEENFSAQVDGTRVELKAGEILRLEPGQSIYLPPFLIHQFWSEEGTGIKAGKFRCTVSGEVSSFCDDWKDNVFLEPSERFPAIDEDEPRRYYLCHEYPPV